MEFDLKELLKQAQQLQEKMREIQERLANKKVTAESGGGMVAVTVNGKQELLSVKLDPVCVDPRDVPMLEDLILTAVNQGIRKAKELAAEEMKQGTGGLPFPTNLV